MTQHCRDNLILVTAILALCGCAASSGALRTGPDTYTISTSASPARGGVPAAKRAAFDEAVAECQRRGLSMTLLNQTTASPTWTEGMASATVDFKCVAP